MLSSFEATIDQATRQSCPDGVNVDWDTTLLVKLRKTFKHLFIRNNSVHDDTLLDKLATWLNSQLCEDEEKCRKTILALNDVQWIASLVRQSETLNESVLSFGLKVLSMLCRSTSGRSLLEFHADGFVTLLRHLTLGFVLAKASLRFALLHLLSQVAGNNSLSFVPDQQDLVDLARMGMSDGSIFVKRCAGDLLVSLFVSPSFFRFDWKPVVVELLDSFTVVRPLGSVSTVDPQVALSVLQRFGSSRFLSTAYPSLQTDMRTVIPQYALKIANDDLRIASYQLMIYLRVTSFDDGSPPPEWVKFLDGLLLTKHIASGEQLLIETCKSLVKCDKLVPSWLNSAMLRPLIIISGWKPIDKSSLLTNRLPEWERRTNAFKIEEKDTLSAKLVFTVLTNIAYLDTCFCDTIDRMHLIDLLLHYLSGQNPFITVNLERQQEKVVALQQKHQSAVMFAISKLLEEWGDNWFKSIKVANQEDIVKRIVLLLHNRAWTGLMAIKATQLLKKLLPLCCHHFEHSWGLLGPQLESSLVHWYFHQDWETTDVVLEVLAVFAELGQSHNFLQTWLETTSMIKITFLALSSSNSYLSSSALAVFGSMRTIPQQIAIGSERKLNKLFLLENVVSALLMGTEGTVRQAAATTLYSWFKRDHVAASDKNLLYGCFVIAAYELYWEVKLVAVDFWDEVFNTFSGSSSVSDDWESLLPPLSAIGFCDAVVGLVEDEDFSVCNKVTDLVSRLVAIVGPAETVPELSIRDETEISNSVAPPAQAPPSEVEEHELATFTEEEKLSAIEATLNTTDIDTIDVLRMSFESREGGSGDSAELPKPESFEEQLTLIDRELQKCLRVDAKREELERLVSNHRRCRSPMTSSAFVAWLRTINVERLNEMTSQCTDLYESNCEALLDDILVVNYESDNEDDETAMDCY